MRTLRRRAAARARDLERRSREPTIWDAFLAYLSREGYAVPDERMERDVTSPIEPSPALQDDPHRDLPRTIRKNGELCERLVDLDEGIQEWRYRHVKMVSARSASSPAPAGRRARKYLETTLGHPAFPDLWAIRGSL